MSDLDGWYRRFGAVARDAEALCFITRAVELQREVLGRVDGELAALGQDKAAAQASGDDNAANYFLALECLFAALAHELRMWVFLKEDEPERAWDELVFAQNALAAAPRAHEVGDIALVRVPWLADVERVVFPPQVFVSAGFTSVARCSICGDVYGKCDHLVGRAYSGRFCSLVHGQVGATEVSFVETPADKRCRVREFSDDGGFRNRMTWRLAGEKTAADV